MTAGVQSKKILAVSLKGLGAKKNLLAVNFQSQSNSDSDMRQDNLPYMYDYITKLCRKQAEVIQNHENEHVHGTGESEARHRKYKRLKLGGGQTYDR
jgi:hypothetical protein